MTEHRIQFEWDYEKEKINIVRHKLNLVDACHAFSDIYQLNIFDKGHSDDEDRWILIGEIPIMKIVVVVHAYRQPHGGEDARIRIISARKGTKKERADYFPRRPR